MAPRSEEEEDSGESEVGCCTKYSIFVFNVLFFLLGFSMVALGTYAQVDNGGIYKKMQQNTGAFAMDPTIIAILVGIVIFIIGFCGCLGSLRENTILLSIYAYVLIAILLIEFIAVGVMYFYKDTAMDAIGNELSGMIPAYNNNEDLQDLMDQIQIMMQCCGIKGPDDWDANMFYAAAGEGNGYSSPFADGVPYSCCVTPTLVRTKMDDNGNEVTETDANTACGKQARKNGLSNEIHQIGCLAAIDDWSKKNGQTLIIVLGVILIIQAVAIMMAQNLKADIKAQRAKWLDCRMGACCCKKKKDGAVGTKKSDLNSTKTKKSGKQAESPPIDQTDGNYENLTIHR